MSSPLIEQLTAQHGYASLTADNIDATLAREATLALFVSEDPQRYPEANDVAVILPELTRAFRGQFEPLVVDRTLEPLLKDRYDIAVWPCLVFLRNGRFLGKISKVRDWSEYLERIGEILDSVPRHNPGVGIPVVNEPLENTHA
ncbi:MAG: hypothetical protein KDJ24_15655 [Gammaproteobacteria bacterium]|nr:hypothetical protein [Gammaproteobacteria bacterium]